MSVIKHLKETTTEFFNSSGDQTSQRRRPHLTLSYYKQAVKGISRLNILGSKIAKGLQSVKCSFKLPKKPNVGHIR